MLVEANEEAIINAIKLISRNPEKYKNECMDRTKDFDMTVFIKKMKYIISLKANNTIEDAYERKYELNSFLSDEIKSYITRYYFYT
jgi:hypothetical protein